MSLHSTSSPWEENPSEKEKNDAGFPVQETLNYTPKRLRDLLTVGDPMARRYVEQTERENQMHWESNDIGGVRGVSATINRALNFVDAEHARQFADRLAQSARMMESYRPYIYDKAQKTGQTPFFVLAHMTGELGQYYRRMLQSHSNTAAVAVTASNAPPSFVKEMETFYGQEGLPVPDFEFELMDGGTLGNDRKDFEKKLVQSHRLLINLFFAIDQEMHTKETIAQLNRYAQNALNRKAEDDYWQGF